MRPYVAPSPEAIGIVLEAIGEGGKRGLKVAKVLPLLVLWGAELGELIEYDTVAAGIEHDGTPDGKRKPWRVPVVGRGMPAEWFERLADAIESDAIDRFTAEQVVDVLLRPKQ